MHDFLTGNTFSGNYDLPPTASWSWTNIPKPKPLAFPPDFCFLSGGECFNVIFAALALLSFALALWQFLAARKFPLHQRIADANFAPAISILKPLKGCDDTTADSLQSWLKQNYAGQTQILFGVADPSDPVCKIVRELLQKNPGVMRNSSFAKNLGANAKVAKLAQLEKLAQHDLILISDADVRVPPDFLANFVAPLRDEKIGLVNCFYRLANPATPQCNGKPSPSTPISGARFCSRKP